LKEDLLRAYKDIQKHSYFSSLQNLNRIEERNQSFEHRSSVLIETDLWIVLIVDLVNIIVWLILLDLNKKLPNFRIPLMIEKCLSISQNGTNQKPVLETR